MERTLRRLFDFQRFEGDAHLARLIGETESRLAGGVPGRIVLEEEELELNAAGDTPLKLRTNDSDEQYRLTHTGSDGEERWTTTFRN